MRGGIAGTFEYRYAEAVNDFRFLSGIENHAGERP
jgi:hypothetical protein